MRFLKLCKDFFVGWIVFTQETLEDFHKFKEKK
jgi:hypothetical protein